MDCSVGLHHLVSETAVACSIMCTIHDSYVAIAGQCIQL